MASNRKKSFSNGAKRPSRVSGRFYKIIMMLVLLPALGFVSYNYGSEIFDWSKSAGLSAFEFGTALINSSPSVNDKDQRLLAKRSGLMKASSEDAGTRAKLGSFTGDEEHEQGKKSVIKITDQKKSSDTDTKSEVPDLEKVLEISKEEARALARSEEAQQTQVDARQVSLEERSDSNKSSVNPGKINAKVAEVRVAEINQQISEEESKVRFLESVLKRYLPNQESRTETARLIVALGKSKSLDPLFITAWIGHESNFKADLVGESSKTGLLQIDSFKAPAFAKLAKVAWKNNRALLEPEYNLQLGLSYFNFLKKLLKGDQRLALMAYKFGARSFLNALKVKAEIPDSVFAYAKEIQESSEKYQGIYKRFHQSLLKATPKKNDEVVQNKGEQPGAVNNAPKANDLSMSRSNTLKDKNASTVETKVGEVEIGNNDSQDLNSVKNQKKIPVSTAIKVEMQPEEELPLPVAEDAGRARMKTDPQTTVVEELEPKFRLGLEGIKIFESGSDLLQFLILSENPERKEASTLASMIESVATEYKIDPLLVAALAKVRTNFNSTFKNAENVGLFALSNDFVKEVSQKAQLKLDENFTIENDYNSLKLVSSYLSYLRWRHGGHIPHLVLAFLWEPGKLASASQTKISPPRSVREESQKVFSFYNKWKSSYTLDK